MPRKRAMPQIIAGIVAKAAVAMNFAEVGKDALDVVERIGTVGMARQLGALPRSQLSRHLPAQRVDAIVQDLQLALRVLIVAGGACSCSICVSMRSSSSCALEAASILGRSAGCGSVNRFDRTNPEVQGGQHSGLLRLRVPFLGHGFTLGTRAATAQSTTRTLPRPHNSSTRLMKARSGNTL